MTIPKSKTDQMGAKATHEKHVFANPLMPEICPILALAILFATTTPSSESEIEYPNLFDAGEQSLRFSKILKSVMTEEEIRDLITDLRDQGTHGIRKGAGSFLANASTAGPSHATVLNRGNWALGVLSRYLFSEKAGDCYAGRILAGLPVNSAAFATNCPDFVSGFEEVRAAFDVVFPGYAEYSATRPVLRRCLACLVYHRQFLLETLPDGHPLLDNVLFNDAERMASLASHVKIDSGIEDGASSRSSGIPPHTTLLQGLQEVKDTMVNAMHGNVSPSTLKKVFKEVLQPLVDTVQHSAALSAQNDPEAVVSEIVGDPPCILSYSFRWANGQYGFLPENFRLSGRTKLYQGLRVWFFSAGEHDGRKLRPLRLVKYGDFSTAVGKRNFVRLRAVATAIHSGIETPMPKDEQELGAYFRKAVRWLQGLLEQVRERQREEAKSSASGCEPPKTKRMRKTCRVTDLGMNGFYQKLEDLKAEKML